jgi:malonyl-CoA decarboxylase
MQLELGQQWRHLLGHLGFRAKARDIQTVKEALELATALLSIGGEAGQVRLAQTLADLYSRMDDHEALGFFQALIRGFAPEHASLSQAAEAYLSAPGSAEAAQLWQAAEPPRQELIRRLNMAQGGTKMIVAMRERALRLQTSNPELAPLTTDLRHLLGSWFNRGFLQVRQIDWNTPATVLEKLIRYEAVHAIKGWDDLRHRVEGDRRCFGFFHPAMPDEPIIFIEVALTSSLSDDIAPLLKVSEQPRDVGEPMVAIFYSISNCQPGLRNIQFGDFLIKQVVSDLARQFPSLRVFATLSPIPGFAKWLDQAIVEGKIAPPSLAELLQRPDWVKDSAAAEVLRRPLMSLCARYLTGQQPDGSEGAASDPVARFHLSNGARIERINWGADLSDKGVKQSWGLMVNYRYSPNVIDANQEAFAFRGVISKTHSIASLADTPIRLAGA